MAGGSTETLVRCPKALPMTRENRLNCSCSRRRSLLLLAGVLVSRPVFLSYAYLPSFKILPLHHRGLLLLRRLELLPLRVVVVVVVFLHPPLKPLVSDLTPCLSLLLDPTIVPPEP